MSHHPRKPTQFYPGLAAFTDAIDALPQETIRHFTLLREVDAKASGPEDLLRSSIKHSLGVHSPADSINKSDPYRVPNNINGLLDDSLLEIGSYSLGASEENVCEHDRRSRLHEVRLLISDLLLTLDEKIHVISTASEALSKHLVRIDDAYENVTQEIDPVIRDGNPVHWAYGNPVFDGSASIRQGGHDHSNGQTPNVNTYALEVESGLGTNLNSRTESRREGVSRRHAQALEMDFKGNSHQSVPILPESSNLTHENSPSLPAAKRRKGTNQNAVGNKTSALDRNLGSVRNVGQGNSITSLPASKGQVSQPPTSSISSGKPPSGRKRISGQLPSSTSSPISQSFSDIRLPNTLLLPSESSIIGHENIRKETGHRIARSKNQQTKTELSKPTPKPEVDVKQEDSLSFFDSGSSLPLKLAPQDRKLAEGANIPDESIKETDREKEQVAKSQSVAEHAIKVLLKDDKPQSLPSLTSANTEKASKPNETFDKPASRNPATSISKGSSKLVSVSDSSKPPQPVSRKAITAKALKSNKGHPSKDRVEGETSESNENIREHDEDDDIEGDPDEMRYCYCNQVSYGKMVACDGPGCQREWFHLPCVGLTHMPSTKGLTSTLFLESQALIQPRA
ncbi:hypothetical protein TWF694_008650 [Orbilia ellipsospora]|uniref:Inhibitor of growth protein N-terminal histone-binding domain-containing protein n=1 Tax=Orbilia ellipsospora TaxID=2528407 RepID=A0AAV9XHA3_9PEZI